MIAVKGERAALTTGGSLYQEHFSGTFKKTWDGFNTSKYSIVDATSSGTFCSDGNVSSVCPSIRRVTLYLQGRQSQKAIMSHQNAITEEGTELLLTSEK